MKQSVKPQQKPEIFHVTAKPLRRQDGTKWSCLILEFIFPLLQLCVWESFIEVCHLCPYFKIGFICEGAGREIKDCPPSKSKRPLASD